MMPVEYGEKVKSHDKTYAVEIRGEHHVTNNSVNQNKSNTKMSAFLYDITILNQQKKQFIYNVTFITG